MEKTFRNKYKAFTLLEMMITVLIIAVVAAVVVPMVLHRIEKAKEAEAVHSLGAIRSAELLLHNLTGKFVAAVDEAGIQTALGLVVGGGFYQYRIIEADAENFLATATPLGMLENWLEEIKINKDGFVGYTFGEGGGSGSGSGGGSGGSSGGGSGGGSGGSSGGGSGNGGGGGGVGSTVDVGSVQSSTSKPAFTGYAASMQEVLDTLLLSTAALTSEGATTGKALSEYAQAQSWSIDFYSASVLAEMCGSSRALGCQEPFTDGTSRIAISDAYLGNKYAAAAIVGHEILHAVWWEDYAAYYYLHTQAEPVIGMPIPSGGIRHNYSEDQEYNTKKAGGEIWLDLRTQFPALVYDDSGLWDQLASDERYFVGVPEDEAKGYLGSIYGYVFDYTY